jgi:hypothetical protein
MNRVLLINDYITPTNYKKIKGIQQGDWLDIIFVIVSNMNIQISITFQFNSTYLAKNFVFSTG